MSNIRVSILPATNECRLYPKYDVESDILTVTSLVPREWPYGVDIDGNIVFDLDSNRILANFDLHKGRHLWEPGLVQDWPGEAAAGGIVFLPETIKHKSFQLPLQVQYDTQQGIVRIDFDIEQGHSAVLLSDDCIALLADDMLTGFLVRVF
jgi:hypothetical protein